MPSNIEAESVSRDEYTRRRDAAFAAHAARIQKKLTRLGTPPKQSTRGSGGNAVFCLNADGDGKPRRFATFTEAAKWAGVGRGDSIYKAIVRGGLCAGRRWVFANARQITEEDRERVRDRGRKHERKPKA